MVVWNGPEGQRASLAFQERTAALAGQPPTSSKEPFKLAVYGRGTLKSLKRLGSLEIRKPPKCFHIEPRSEASGFVSKFYTSLSLVVPSFLYAQLIFCQTELGLIVGIGPNRDSHGSWISSDYGFKLELQSANVREIAALPKDSLEGPPRAGFEATPPKRPRRAEEGSVGMDHHLASSFSDAGGFQVQYDRKSNSANDAALPLLEGLEAVNSPPPELNTGAHSDDKLLEFVFESLGEYHAPLPIGSTTDALNGGSGREYSGEASSSIIDGLYETANETGFDQLKMLSVNIRTEHTDHPRVELVADFQHYELRLCEECAVWREGCLQLDFSKEAYDPETIIFRDALKLDYIYFTSFRICGEGGELVLMFDTSGYSEGSTQRDLFWKLKNPFSPVCSGGAGAARQNANLVDFEMVVWDGPRGQMATFAFLERQEALAGHEPCSSDPVELVWYHNPNCFHGSSLVRVSVFMGAFYSFLKLTEFQGRIGKGGHLIICQTELGLVVGLGPREREIPHSVNHRMRERELYHYGFQLARQISANEGTAGVSERAKERISHPVSKDGLQTPFDRAEETPLDANELGGGSPGSREEEVWSSVDDAAIPSFRLPATAQPAPLGPDTTAQQGVDWINSAVETQGAYYLRPHAELWPGYYGGLLELPEDSSTASIIPFGGDSPLESTITADHPLHRFTPNYGLDIMEAL
ncbi:hypothetical protein FOZ63_006776 [Perkinsus olseni]|uniref:Uncharacterized protein n=1 Tax=Perkinsus olseni TaxID=32597 RepID=A0A7J6RB85_PEROL|nr:hypothetical protein FOZ63_006776 [Perkinsus olseni]